MTIHRVFRCLITSQRLTDLWPPTHSGTPSHTSDAQHYCGRSKRDIYHQRSSRKVWSCQRLVRARQLSFRLASRTGDGSDPAFSHLCLLPALPDRRAWSPLSWTGRLTPGMSVAWVPATFRGALVGSSFLKGRTAYRGYFSAFAFFLPTFAPFCLRASFSLCSSA